MAMVFMFTTVNTGVCVHCTYSCFICTHRFSWNWTS